MIPHVLKTCRHLKVPAWHDFVHKCPFPATMQTCINPLRPRQNGRHFANDTLNRIFLNENVRIAIKISLKFAPKGPINNIPALVQIMAWRRLGDKPLSEPMIVSLLTHICVTRPQWVMFLMWLFQNISWEWPGRNCYLCRHWIVLK